MSISTRRIAAATGTLTLAFALALTGCSSASAPAPTSTSAATGATTAATSDAAGFEEFPIGDDQELFPLSVAGVYFQPIDMEPSGMGLSASHSSFHLEADIAAMADNKLGYGVGDFIPGLTVDYSITQASSGDVVSSGTFMTMNASDGPHYGANVKLDKAGTYQLKLSIESPASKGWMLHVDPETGVKGHFWTEPIEVTFDNWDYTPRQW